MTPTVATGSRSRNLVLAAMIFAVAMTFIDQTIVSIAVPEIQKELGLTSTGVQWAVNAYLLSLAAFFAFGGRLADTLGHRKMVVIGVVVFAAAPRRCAGSRRKGASPRRGSWRSGWFRASAAAIMFPAALAIVVQTFPLHDRGKALAMFFGIAGGLTAVGPVLGGVSHAVDVAGDLLGEHSGRADRAGVDRRSRSRRRTYRPARMDYRGLVLIAAGVALSVFGFQQSTIWGWSNPGIAIAIAAGLALLVVFYVVERRTTRR